MHVSKSLLLLSAIALSPTVLQAGSPVPPVDKWQYHLFNPTPREAMRDFSTDRPDTTESAYTVDAGHFQVEASMFDYGRDTGGGVRTETWTFGAMNLKAGLLNNVDLQVVFDAYTEQRTREAGITDTVSGFSDVVTRLKVNLWGNDGGKTALAVMPFVKIPTGTDLSNNEWEGGIIVPLAIEVTEGVGVGLMLEADFVYDEATGDYETEWVHTATVGFDVTERLGAYVEYVGVTSSQDGFDYKATFDAGLTYGVTENLRLDAGVRIGLNEAAEDFGVFTGLSVRF